MIMDNGMLSAAAAGYALGGKKVAIVARDQKAAKQFLHDVANRIDNAGGLGVASFSRMCVVTKSGGEVDFWSAHQKLACRGREYDLIYVDEVSDHMLHCNLIP